MNFSPSNQVVLLLFQLSVEVMYLSGVSHMLGNDELQNCTDGSLKSRIKVLYISMFGCVWLLKATE